MPRPKTYWTAATKPDLLWSARSPCWVGYNGPPASVRAAIRPASVALLNVIEE
jgi:hypothetical protein